MQRASCWNTFRILSSGSLVESHARMCRFGKFGVCTIFSQTASMLTSTKIESRERVIPVYFGGRKNGVFFPVSNVRCLIYFL